MADISYVKRKIGQSYLVWFQNSNLYVQLEEPAWFVFRKLIKRYKVETIATEFSHRYCLGFEESIAFVKDIRLKIEEMNKPDDLDENFGKTLDNFSKYNFTPYSIYRYHMGTKVIRFSYGTDWLEKYIHPLIDHLETSEEINEIPLFELFAYHDSVVFRFNNEVKGIWGKDESHLVKGKVFLELINVLHNKTDADWLMTVHASAITNGRKTILFSAAPGSGKTTIAALLQAQGYKLISDDFVPFDKYSFNAFPFPVAMSVKEGSMDVLTSHYPDLGKKPLNYITPEKNVRYLPVENEMMKMIFPVQEIIFIKYDKKVDFKCVKLEPIQAFKQLLDQIWVPPNSANVDILLSRIPQISFYQLTYSNNAKALDTITQLFEHD